MIIYGYKCFNGDLTSSFGDKFIEGETYHFINPHFGRQGYHMCQRLEDTLRYFDAFNSDVKIGYVKGYGDVHESFDDYNGYYNMYAVEYLEIIHILTREEIINYALNLPDTRAKRFLELFLLTDDELLLFEEKFKDNYFVLSSINYYQKEKKLVKKLNI